MATRAQIQYGVFCELIRVESTGQITAVGMWGRVIRLQGYGPAILPNLSFHAYLWNPDEETLKADASFTIPGLVQNPKFTVPVTPEKGMNGYNLNFALAGVPLTESGEITLCLEINTDPPIVENYKLDVQFMPLSQ